MFLKTKINLFSWQKMLTINKKATTFKGEMSCEYLNNVLIHFDVSLLIIISLERTIFMTLSILASLIIAVTLPLSYGFVKGLGSIYSIKVLKSHKMIKESGL